ncbi:MAG: GDSL-type esterase/lipase family protein [Verrucomicrobiota bacterium]
MVEYPTLVEASTIAARQAPSQPFHRGPINQAASLSRPWTTGPAYLLRAIHRLQPEKLPRPAWAWLAAALTWSITCPCALVFATDPTTSIRPEGDRLPLVQAIPRRDLNSQRAHMQLLEKTKRGKIDVYFEGDSITRRWGTSDPQYHALLAHWRQNFLGWNAANFGWGGDTVQNILWRLENGELDDVHPKAIVLMAGTNNLQGEEVDSAAKVDEIAAGIEAIVAIMQQKAPQSVIVLTSITPRVDRAGTTHTSTIQRINDRIARKADGKRVRYIDLHSRLADPSGRPRDGMTADGLHLTVQAYEIWASALKPILTELLGPPAPIDQAPPPTGDPSLGSTDRAGDLEALIPRANK